MLEVGVRMCWVGLVVRISKALSWGSCWRAGCVFGWTDSMNSPCSLTFVSAPAIFIAVPSRQSSLI